MRGNGLSLFEERMMTRVAGDGDGERGFDPTIIITLIAALIPVVIDCFKNRTTRQRPLGRIRGRLLGRARIAAAYRREQPDLSWAQSLRLADYTFDVADEATEEEVETFIKDCCGEG